MKKDVSFSSRPPSTGKSRAAEAFAASVDALGLKPPPEPMKRLTIDVPASLHARVKLNCVKNDQAIAEVVRHLLETRFPAE